MSIGDWILLAMALAALPIWIVVFVRHGRAMWHGMGPVYTSLVVFFVFGSIAMQIGHALPYIDVTLADFVSGMVGGLLLVFGASLLLAGPRD